MKAPWSFTRIGEIKNSEGETIAIVTAHSLTISEGAKLARVMAAAPDLLEAVKDLFKMMDEEILVRNTDGDSASDWALKAMSIVLRLKAASNSIKKAEEV